MCKMINQYADKIKGQFAFFDCMIINGYFQSLLSEQTRIDYLYSMGIPLRDFTGYFKNVTDRMTDLIEASANELCRPIVYLPSAMDKKVLSHVGYTVRLSFAGTLNLQQKLKY